jgi:hypothetical protein
MATDGRKRNTGKTKKRIEEYLERASQLPGVTSLLRKVTDRPSGLKEIERDTVRYTVLPHSGR